MVALTQTTSEAILIHKAWQWAAREAAELVMRSDSSVARAIASRLGVGRVRHLQTSGLWIQQWVLAKLLRVAAVPTQFNPSDMCTKSLQQRRLKMLCFLAGLVDDHGQPVGQEEHGEALGRDVLGRQGGELMVRMVQAPLLVTMQGCDGTAGAPGTAEALIFYFVETVLGNPLLMIMVFGIYLATAIQWNVNVRAQNHRAASADQVVQTEVRGDEPTAKDDGAETPPSEASTTLTEKQRRLGEELTYKDIFEGLGLRSRWRAAARAAALPRLSTHEMEVNEGQEGRWVDDIVVELAEGRLKPSDLPLTAVKFDAVYWTLNNRSLYALNSASRQLGGALRASVATFDEMCPATAKFIQLKCSSLMAQTDAECAELLASAERSEMEDPGGQGDASASEAGERRTTASPDEAASVSAPRIMGPEGFAIHSRPNAALRRREALNQQGPGTKRLASQQKGCGSFMGDQNRRASS
eukprot:s3170_g4.t1